MRPGSVAEGSATMSYESLPMTSGWPLPTNTLYVPPSCTTTLAPTSSVSMATAWSRWSSRSFGGWPPPAAVMRVISLFRFAICLV
ncbi:hypothetical protein D3C86_1794730 [compost metagenome]